MTTIAIQLTQNNKPIKTTVTPLHGGGFRIEATFTAASKQPKLCLAPNDTSKQYTFAEANLNRGTKALDYVKPETSETVIKELFDNLNQIKLDFKNADEGLTNKINLTAEGLTALLTKQGNDLSKQIHSIRSTADFYERVLGTTENNVASNLSRMVQASGVIQTEVMKKIDPKLDNKADKSIVESLSTKVTQTADSWAVKNLNSSGDVLAELNQTSGITKIKNNLIQLDGDTSMTNAFADNLLTKSFSTDSLKAFSAKIQNLIVANVDARSVTGLDANFIRARLNSASSNVTITGEGFTVLHKNGRKTVIDYDGLYHYDGGWYHTHYLHDVIPVSDLNHTSDTGYKWVTIPSVYHGKRFNAQVAFADACVWKNTNGDYQNGWLVLQRIVCYVQRDSIDYDNGRVPIVGYARYWNARTRKAEQYDIQVQLIIDY